MAKKGPISRFPKEAIPLLGTMTDAKLAKQLSIGYHTVVYARLSRGVEPFRKWGVMTSNHARLKIAAEVVEAQSVRKVAKKRKVGVTSIRTAIVGLVDCKTVWTWKKEARHGKRD